MPKQPAKTTRQSAKYREQQLRRRMAAQSRAGETMDYPADGEALGAPANGAATVNLAPAAPAAPRVVPRPTVAPRTPAAPSAAMAARASRGRLAAQMQAMNLEEEMAYIRADVRRLLILAGLALIALIVLAILL